MFNRCSECNKLYLLKVSAISCEIAHDEAKERLRKIHERIMREFKEMHYDKHPNRKAWEDSEERRRREEADDVLRRSRSSSTPTSNSVLDSTIITGGYSDYSSYDSGSSCDTSSNSSSPSCDF